MQLPDFLINILDQLTSSPGYIVYHLMMTFWAFGALLIAVNYTRQNEPSLKSRGIAGLSVLLGIRLLLLIAFGLIADPEIFLPPIERALDAIGLVVILWMWAFQKPDRRGDITAAATIGLLIIAGIASTVIWLNPAYSQTYASFNISPLDIAWIALLILVILAGEVILITAQPKGWANGFMVVVVVFFGVLSYIVFIKQFPGNFSSLIRLSQLAAYPFLITLIQTFPVAPPISHAEEAPAEEGKNGSTGELPKPPFKATETKRLLNAFDLALQDDPAHLCQKLTTVISQAIIADVCLLVTPGDAGQVVVQCGYDLITEKNIKGSTLKKSIVPQLSAAMRRGSYLMLPPEDDSKDLPNLAKLLGSDTVGGLLSVPIVSGDKTPIATLVLLSPYSQRTWSEEDHTYINDISPAIIQIIEKVQADFSQNQEFERLKEELEQEKTERETLAAQAETLQKVEAGDIIVIEELARVQSAYNKASETLEQLEKENETLREELGLLHENTQQVFVGSDKIDELKAENDELKATIASLEVFEEMAAEVAQDAEQAKAELEKVQGEKADLIAKIEDLETTVKSGTAPTVTTLGKTKDELDKLQKENAILRAEIEDLKTASDTPALEAELEDLKAEKAELDEQRTALEELQAEKAELIAQLAALESIEAEKAELVEQMAALEAELETAKTRPTRQSLTEVQEKLDILRTENQHLQSQVEDLQLKAIEAEKHRIENEQLQAANQALEAQIAEIQTAEEVTKVQEELNLALTEVAGLEAALADAKKKLTAKAASKPAEAAPQTEQNEVIASMAQDLRQPMSSIIGYTDLLLSESVGILGALQRKFLERVKTSTDRMNTLLGDLVQIATLDPGMVDVSPEYVDLISVIDDTINTTSTQLREKNIALRVDIPTEMPKLHTDRDSLQQIVLHLLQNAGACTPVEGEILLRAQVQADYGQEDYVLVQISDTGGGIPAEDLGRVFSRLYRADNPLIQGVGDTGVGLSIAKALTEALGGRIWVDSEVGAGATFSVLLPLENNLPSNNGNGHTEA
ncbi:MAG: hypothetical protein JXB38_21250 [Anaerolineales bacterium]|nr:hypothetical protein [Anaerolineales bacterium]